MNIGLPILECPEAVAGTREGDEVEVDVVAGRIANIMTGHMFAAVPFPPFMRELMAAGGLIAYARRRLAR